MIGVRWRAVAALALLVPGGCAASALRLEKGENTYSMRRAALEEAVETALKRDEWTYAKRGAAIEAVKRDGPRKTILQFHFADERTRSSFTFVAKSQHVWNWATAGILGLTKKELAAQDGRAWIEAFRTEHEGERSTSSP